MLNILPTPFIVPQFAYMFSTRLYVMKTSNSQPLWKTSSWTHLPFANATYYTNMHNIQHLNNNHYGNIEGFVIGLIEFFNCNRHLQSWSLYNMNAIGHVATITSNTPRLYMIPCIIKHMCNSNVTRCNCVAIGCPCQFFVQMFANKWMPTWLFIHPLMDEVFCVLCNLLALILPLIICVGMLWTNIILHDFSFIQQWMKFGHVHCN